MSKHFKETDAQILEEILKLRRDVRGNRFIDEPVSEAIVNKLIDAALYAPSVGFSQPWQFVIIRDEKVKKRVYNSFLGVNQYSSQLFKDKKEVDYNTLKLEGIMEAPVNIAVLYKANETPVLGQTSMKDMGRFSVVCAIQNLWLMARSLNIGVGWVSILDPEEVKKSINAEDNTELIGYLCIGYVDEFLEEPELKSEGWEVQKKRENVVFYDSVTSSLN
jgi:5,6-dimethylbenzimidazole synthase